jgi:hypothetical protein
LTAKPRTSRGVSTDPAPPATVEKRVNTSVCWPFFWNRSATVISARLGALEIAVRGRAAGVDNALGDAFVIEMVHLLAEDFVLDQHRPRGPAFSWF